MEVFHFKFKFPQLPSASGFFFCHNWPTLTLSYFIAFSIAQTTPQLVCMWSVMKSPVKPAWIKWKLSMFSSRFFPRPSYIGWFFTFNVEDEILCCYHSNETSLAERLNSTVYFYALCKKVTVELCHFAEEMLRNKNMFTWHTITLSLTITVSRHADELLLGLWGCFQPLKMKKWSSQWTQFMQLRKEAWKKFRTSTGFEPVTSRYRCDALPTELWSHWHWEQVNCGFICSRERNEC